MNILHKKQKKCRNKLQLCGKIKGVINDIFSGTDSYTLNIGKSETIELYKKILKNF